MIEIIMLMFLNTKSSYAPEHIIIDVTFGYLIRIQSYLEAFSGASVVFIMSLLYAPPVMPSTLRAFWSDKSSAVYIGKHPLRLPGLLLIVYLQMSYLVLLLLWYFFSWPSPRRYSHGTVSSMLWCCSQRSGYWVSRRWSRAVGIVISPGPLRALGCWHIIVLVPLLLASAIGFRHLVNNSSYNNHKKLCILDYNLNLAELFAPVVHFPLFLCQHCS